MTKKEREARAHLRWKVFEDEGLDYTIRTGGYGEDIRDPMFTKLEADYCEAAAALEEWIRDNCPETEDEE